MSSNPVTDMTNAHLLDQLQQALGGRRPPFLAEMPEKDLRALLEAIQNAKARESKALDDAVGAALQEVPAMLRKPLRKILFRDS